MKLRFCEVLMLFFAQTACCASDARITLRVTDDTGNVVTNALVKLSTFDRWIRGEAAGRDILRYEQTKTDTNGMASLTILCKNGKIGYGVYVDKYSTGNYAYWMNGMKYYTGGGGTFFLTNEATGKWHPWNPLLEVQIKRVLHPIPMYAKRVQSGCEWRGSENKLAYDLVKGDWVKPYGKGETEDFIFCGTHTVTGKSRYGTDYYEMKLEMVFTNEGDGVYCVRVPPRQGSVLRLPHFAPESGYDPVLRQEKHVRPYDQLHMSGTESMQADKENNKQSLEEDLNYFFRVRTKKNGKGEIVSALYGKIYGPVDFMISAQGMSVGFTYYLNPTSNDRNTEFDCRNYLAPRDPTDGDMLP